MPSKRKKGFPGRGTLPRDYAHPMGMGPMGHPWWMSQYLDLNQCDEQCTSTFGWCQCHATCFCFIGFMTYSRLEGLTLTKVCSVSVSSRGRI